ncbi:MAG: hypothetical protein ABSE53_01485 [Terracidiphilus sp.]|jgi:hypothetical protein
MSAIENPPSEGRVSGVAISLATSLHGVLPVTSVRYFVTEKDESAKIGDMVKQRKSLKERLATLENEFTELSREWHLLSGLSDTRDFSNERYVVNDDELKVMRPSRYTGTQQERQYEEAMVLSLKALDKDAVIRLFKELSETRNDLNRVSSQLRPFGID